MRGHFFISRIILSRVGSIFHVGPMIDKRSDFDLAGKLSHASHMVAVKMRNQYVIDSVDAGSFSRADDPVGISPIKPGPAGINEHGLA